MLILQKKIIISTVLFLLFNQLSNGQGLWSQKADFGGGLRTIATGFSIGNKAYIGTGSDANGCHPDFWEWDQSTDVWNQKASFPGTLRNGSVSFSIGNKGYIGTGGFFSGFNSDFWEWDQATDTWTQKTNYPGAGGYMNVGFSIGNKGYIGTGADFTNHGKIDFWEWDQATDVWTQKANFPGTGRWGAYAFSIGTKGYIGGGNNSSNNFSDFWEWDQTTDVWAAKAYFGGPYDASFSIGTKGFVCTPYSTYNFWEWNQATNLWTHRTDFGGTGRDYAVGFSIGEKGYIGTGGMGGNTTFKDFWEYCDTCSSVGLHELENKISLSIFPNPFSSTSTLYANKFFKNATLTFYNLYGQQVKQIKNISEQTITLTRENLPSGMYFISLTQDKSVFATDKLIITDN